MNLDLAKYQEVTEHRLNHINIGSGVDCSIAELASTIAEVTGFTGAIKYDTSKPDGAPRKLMDNSKLRALGWQPIYTLKTGVENAYTWYLENIDNARI